MKKNLLVFFAIIVLFRGTALAQNQNNMRPALQISESQVNTLLSREDAEKKDRELAPLLQKYPPSIQELPAGNEVIRIMIEANPNFPPAHQGEIRAVRLETEQGRLLGRKEYSAKAPFGSADFLTNVIKFKIRQGKIVVIGAAGNVWEKAITFDSPFASSLPPAPQKKAPLFSPPSQASKDKAPKKRWPWG